MNYLIISLVILGLGFLPPTSGQSSCLFCDKQRTDNFLNCLCREIFNKQYLRQTSQDELLDMKDGIEAAVDAIHSQDMEFREKVMINMLVAETTGIMSMSPETTDPNLVAEELSKSVDQCYTQVTGVNSDTFVDLYDIRVRAMLGLPTQSSKRNVQSENLSKSTSTSQSYANNRPNYQYQIQNSPNQKIYPLNSYSSTQSGAFNTQRHSPDVYQSSERNIPQRDLIYPPPDSSSSANTRAFSTAEQPALRNNRALERPPNTDIPPQKVYPAELPVSRVSSRLLPPLSSSGTKTYPQPADSVSYSRASSQSMSIIPSDNNRPQALPQNEFQQPDNNKKYGPSQNSDLDDSNAQYQAENNYPNQEYYYPNQQYYSPNQDYGYTNPVYDYPSSYLNYPRSNRMDNQTPLNTVNSESVSTANSESPKPQAKSNQESLESGNMKETPRKIHPATSSTSGAHSDSPGESSSSASSQASATENDNNGDLKHRALILGERLFVFFLKNENFCRTFGRNTSLSSAKLQTFKIVKKGLKQSGYSSVAKTIAYRCRKAVSSLKKGSSSQAYSETISKTIMQYFFENNLIESDSESQAKNIALSMMQWLPKEKQPSETDESKYSSGSETSSSTTGNATSQRSGSKGKIPEDDNKSSSYAASNTQSWSPEKSQAPKPESFAFSSATNSQSPDSTNNYSGPFRKFDSENTNEFHDALTRYFSSSNYYSNVFNEYSSKENAQNWAIKLPLNTMVSLYGERISRDTAIECSRQISSVPEGSGTEYYASAFSYAIAFVFQSYGIVWKNKADIQATYIGSKIDDWIRTKTGYAAPSPQQGSKSQSGAQATSYESNGGSQNAPENLPENEESYPNGYYGTEQNDYYDNDGNQESASDNKNSNKRNSKGKGEQNSSNKQNIKTIERPMENTQTYSTDNEDYYSTVDTISDYDLDYSDQNTQTYSTDNEDYYSTTDAISDYDLDDRGENTQTYSTDNDDYYSTTDAINDYDLDESDNDCDDDEGDYYDGINNNKVYYRDEKTDNGNYYGNNNNHDDSDNDSNYDDGDDCDDNDDNDYEENADNINDYNDNDDDDYNDNDDDDYNDNDDGDDDDNNENDRSYDFEKDDGSINDDNSNNDYNQNDVNEDTYNMSNDSDNAYTGNDDDNSNDYSDNQDINNNDNDSGMSDDRYESNNDDSNNGSVSDDSNDDSSNVPPDSKQRIRKMMNAATESTSEGNFDYGYFVKTMSEMVSDMNKSHSDWSDTDKVFRVLIESLVALSQQLANNSKQENNQATYSSTGYPGSSSASSYSESSSRTGLESNSRSGLTSSSNSESSLASGDSQSSSSASASPYSPSSYGTASASASSTSYSVPQQQNLNYKVINMQQDPEVRPIYLREFQRQENRNFAVINEPYQEAATSNVVSPINLMQPAGMQYSRNVPMQNVPPYVPRNRNQNSNVRMYN